MSSIPPVSNIPSTGQDALKQEQKKQEEDKKKEEEKKNESKYGDDPLNSEGRGQIVNKTV